MGSRIVSPELLEPGWVRPELHGEAIATAYAGLEHAHRGPVTVTPG
jgi:hypothetical protein